MAAGANKSFKFLATKFKTLQRLGDSKRVGEFMASGEFTQAFSSLSSADKQRIQPYIISALASAQKRVAPLKIPKYSKRGWRSWDDARIARLRSIYNATGSDAVVAAKMGISLPAAYRARLRYVGPKAPIALAA